MNLANFAYQAGMSFLIYGLLARWYVWPFILRQNKETSITILLLPFLLRQVGGTHLAPTVIPVPASYPLAWAILIGDLLCLLCALVTIASLRSFPKWAMALAWLFSAIDVIDYVVIAVWGVADRAYDHLYAHWYVACYYDPLLGVLQVLLTMVLVKREWPGRATPILAPQTA
jgi:hypothetical protein